MSEVKNGRYEEFGNILWYKDGLLHREDGHAYEDFDGTKVWLINGKQHREDGPAVIYGNGAKKWCLNGQLHRENGPAVVYGDGTQQWWIHGIEYTEEEFNSYLSKKQINENLQLNLDNKAKKSKKAKI